MILIVTYDLHQPGRDYSGITALLESASGGFFHLQGSVRDHDGGALHIYSDGL